MVSLHEQTHIEELMGNALTGSLHGQVRIRNEHPAGRRRLDFGLIHAGAVVGVECDGDWYHEFQRDLLRDREILAEGSASAIIRFRGCDIFHDVESCVDWVSRFHPELFDPDCEPRSLEDKALGAMGMVAFGVAPIYRASIGCSEWTAVQGVLRNSSTASVMPLGGRRLLVQFKTPYWRKPNQTGNNRLF